MRLWVSVLSYKSDLRLCKRNRLPNHKKVIALALEWRFFDFADDVDHWYGQLPEEGKDLFNSILKVNSKTSNPQQWIACKLLQGACKSEGIWEWYFSADKVQQRLLGVFGMGRRTAVFLLGCSHKDRVYSPSDSLNSAIKRAKLLRKGGISLRERTIPADF